MNDFLELRHEVPERKNIFVANWVMGDDAIVLEHGPVLSPDTSLNFVQSVIDHYGIFLGKQIVFEFSGRNALNPKRMVPILQAIKKVGGKSFIRGPLATTMSNKDLVEEHVDHLVITVNHDDDFDDIRDFCNELSASTNLSVQVVYDPEIFNIGRALQRMCIDLKETFVHIIIPHELRDSLSTDEIKRLEYTNKKAAKLSMGGKKNRIRFRPRTDMTMIGDDEQTHPASYYIQNGMNKFTDWSCAAGLEQLVIDDYGTIFRGWCKQGDRLGSIFDETFTFPTSPIICSALDCKVGFDLSCTKTWY